MPLTGPEDVDDDDEDVEDVELLAAAALEQGCRCNPPVPSRAL